MEEDRDDEDQNERSREIARRIAADVVFRNDLRQNGFTIIEINGDGNCLFVAVQMGLRENNLAFPKDVREFRAKIAQELRKNKQYKFVKEYFAPEKLPLMTLEQEASAIEDNLWGNELCLIIAAITWNVNFTIVSHPFSFQHFPQKPLHTRSRTILLSYHNGNHYNYLHHGAFSHFKTKKRQTPIPALQNITTRYLGEQDNVCNEATKLQTKSSDLSELVLSRSTVKNKDVDQSRMVSVSRSKKVQVSIPTLNIAGETFTHAESVREPSSLKISSKLARDSKIAMSVPRIILHRCDDKGFRKPVASRNQPTNEVKSNQKGSSLTSSTSAVGTENNEKKGKSQNASGNPKSQSEMKKAGYKSTGHEIPEERSSLFSTIHAGLEHAGLTSPGIELIRPWIIAATSKYLKECKFSKTRIKHAKFCVEAEKNWGTYIALMAAAHEWKVNIIVKWTTGIIKFPDTLYESSPTIYIECTKKQYSLLRKPIDATINTQQQPLQKEMDYQAKGKLQCKFCSYKCNNEDELMKHKLQIHGKGNLYCLLCDISFKTRPQRNKHMEDVHGKTWSCDKCNRSFSRLSVLVRHRKIHAKEAMKKYACRICSKTFTAKWHMDNHMRIFHNSQIGVMSVKQWGAGGGYETVTASSIGSHEQDKNASDKRSTGNATKHKDVNQEEVFACKYCEFKCTSYNELLLHRTGKHGRAKLICITCDISFAALADKKEHMEQFHKDGLHKCDLCDQAFDRPAHMIYHRLTHFEERDHVCSICGRRFASDKNLRAHMTGLHKDAVANNEKIENNATNYEHQVDMETLHSKLPSSRHDEKNVQVEGGFKRNPSTNNPSTGKPDNYEEEKRKSTDSMLPKVVKMRLEDLKTCVHCGIKCTSNNKLWIHKYEKHSRGPICVVCDIKFGSVEDRAEHVLKVHGTQPYKCPVCPSTFSKSTSILDHLDTHFPERKHTCNVCGNSYKLVHTLNAHIRREHQDVNDANENNTKENNDLHSEKEEATKQDLSKNSLTANVFKAGQEATVEPMQCKFCKYKCTTNNLLLLHKYKIHGVTHLKCILCDIVFKKREDRLRHMEVSHPKFPYKCDICGAMFETPTHVIRHRSHHFQTKRVICNVCGMDFRDKYRLTRHLRTHFPRKTFNLEGRGISFMHYKSVLDHLKRKCNQRNGGKSTRLGSGSNKIRAACKLDKTVDSQPKADSELTLPYRLPKERRVQHKTNRSGGEVKGSNVPEVGDNYSSEKSFIARRMSTSIIRTRSREGRVDANILKCIHCDDFTCMSETELLLHKYQKHAHVRVCIICDIEFESKAVKTEHMKEFHTNSPYKCDICQIGFTKPCNLLLHRETHFNVYKHKCTRCDRSFRTAYLLHRHVRSHTSKYPKLKTIATAENKSRYVRSNSNYRKRANHTLESGSHIKHFNTKTTTTVEQKEQEDLEPVYIYLPEHLIKPRNAHIQKRKRSISKQDANDEDWTPDCQSGYKTKKKAKVCNHSASQSRHNNKEKHQSQTSPNQEGLMDGNTSMTPQPKNTKRMKKTRQGTSLSLKSSAIQRKEHHFVTKSQTKSINKPRRKCRICGRHFLLRHYLMLHMRKIHGPEFVCMKCDLVFDSFNSLRLHQSRFHMKLFQCSLCNIRTRTEVGIIHHVKTHSTHNADTPINEMYTLLASRKYEFVCPVCVKRYVNKAELIIHMNRHMMEEGGLQCMECDKRFERPDAFHRHYLLNHDQSDYLRLCGPGSWRKSMRNVLQHALPKKTNVTNAKFYKKTCRTCGERLESPAHARSHYLVKHSTMNVVCHLCWNNVGAPGTHHMHLQLEHNIRHPFKCPICEFTGSRHVIQMHIKKKHEEGVNCNCYDCALDAFTISYGESQTEQTNDNEKQPNNLHINLIKQQQKLSNEEECVEHKCIHCLQVFRWKGDLEAHVNKKHSLKEVIICHLCGTKLSCSGTHSDHLNYHHKLGRSPYKCPECNFTGNRYSFQMHWLKDHLLTSSCKCADCRGRSGCSDDLTEDDVADASIGGIMEPGIVAECNVDGEMANECEECGATYRRPYALRLHNIRVHQNYRITCHICMLGGISLTEHYEHLKEWHDLSSPYNCHLCHLPACSRLGLQMHFKMEHSTANLETCECDDCKSCHCSLCVKQFRSTSCLTKHQILHHSEIPVSCHLCWCELQDPDEHVRHLEQVHVLSPSYKCDRCSFQGERHDFQMHLLQRQRDGDGRVCECRDCSVDLPARKGPSGLRLCNYKIPEMADKEEHLRKQHPPEIRLYPFKRNKIRRLLLGIHRGLPDYQKNQAMKIYLLSKELYQIANQRRKLYGLILVPQEVGDVREYVRDRTENTSPNENQIVGSNLECGEEMMKYFMNCGRLSLGIDNCDTHISFHHYNGIHRVATTTLIEVSKFKMIHVFDVWAEDLCEDPSSFDEVQLIRHEALYILKVYLFAVFYNRMDVFFQNLELAPLRDITRAEVEDIVDDIKQSDGDIFRLKNFKVKFQQEYQRKAEKSGKRTPSYNCMHCHSQMFSASMLQRHLARCPQIPPETNPNPVISGIEKLLSMTAVNVEDVLDACNNSPPPTRKYYLYSVAAVKAVFSSHKQLKKFLKLYKNHKIYHGKSVSGKLSLYHSLDGKASTLKNLVDEGYNLYLVMEWECSSYRDMMRLEVALQINELWYAQFNFNTKGRVLANKNITTYNIWNLFTMDEWLQLYEYSKKNRLLYDDIPAFLNATRTEKCSNVSKSAK